MIPSSPVPDSKGDIQSPFPSPGGRDVVTGPHGSISVAETAARISETKEQYGLKRLEQKG